MKTIMHYGGDLNRWGQSKNKITPDTLTIFKEYKRAHEYDDEGNLIGYQLNTMSDKTLELTKKAHREWIEPIMGEIPISIKDRLDYAELEKADYFNQTIVLPFNTLNDDYGIAGSMHIAVNPDEHALFSQIMLQTNPDMLSQDHRISAIILHELASSMLYNSQARIRGVNSEIARLDETILAITARPGVLTSYDMKSGRLIRNELLETGTPQNHIIGIPSKYEK